MKRSARTELLEELRREREEQEARERRFEAKVTEAGAGTNGPAVAPEEEAPREGKPG